MRRRTWSKSLRVTLLVAGFSLGASAVMDPSIQQSTLVAAEDSVKESATVEEAAIGDALKDAGLGGKKPAK